MIGRYFGDQLVGRPAKRRGEVDLVPNAALETACNLDPSFPRRDLLRQIKVRFVNAYLLYQGRGLAQNRHYLAGIVAIERVSRREYDRLWTQVQGARHWHRRVDAVLSSRIGSRRDDAPLLW